MLSAELLYLGIALLAELQQCHPSDLKRQVLLLAFVVSHFRDLLVLLPEAMGSSGFSPMAPTVCVYMFVYASQNFPHGYVLWLDC